MNINKKLLEIFDRKDFRYGDKIKDRINPKDHTIIQRQDESSFMLDNGEVLDVENLTLIQPAVTLSDVLVKIKEHEKELLIDHEGKMIQYEWNGIDDILKVKAEWQLDKDLWLQSDETKKFISEVLE